jgi:DNA-binding PadR family transcriptional regulator
LDGYNVIICKCRSGGNGCEEAEEEGRKGKVKSKGGGAEKTKRKEKKMVQITDRDIKIFQFLGKHRFATVAQIARYVGANEKKAYKRLNSLRKTGFLAYERIFYREKGVYFLRSKGRQVLGLDAANSSRVVPGTYRHDLFVIDIALEFQEKGYEITTEKEMFSAQFSGFGSRGKKERRPDLVASKNGENIAIELEVAVHNRRREGRSGACETS